MDGKDQRYVFEVRLLPILIQGVEVGRYFKWHDSSFERLGEPPNHQDSPSVSAGQEILVRHIESDQTAL